MQKKRRLKFEKIINIAFFGAMFIFLFTAIAPISVRSQSIQEKIYQKQKELESVQKKINVMDLLIKSKEKKAKTAEQEISILNNSLEQQNLEIQKTSIAVEQTRLDIEIAQDNIAAKEILIESEKKIIKDYLRILYKTDGASFLEIILSEDKISDAWREFEAVKSIQSKMKSALKKIKQEKTSLEENKDKLLEKQEEQNYLLMMQESQEEALRSDKILKEKFLKKIDNQKKRLKASLDSAAKIKNSLKEEIFNLKSSGVSMSMKKALDIARFAASKTGIRPEFLLGLLKVESDLGNNVGTGNYKTDMNPHQHEAFFAITKKIGMNPETAPVSKKPKRYKGWGGAMGPAQMMPKTWLGYEAAVAALTGHNPPSPWDNKDAFTAAAIKLSRDGASSKTRDGEWKAAMKYLAGRNWNNPKLAWYGNRVLKLAEVYGS